MAAAEDCFTEIPDLSDCTPDIAANGFWPAFDIRDAALCAMGVPGVYSAGIYPDRLRERHCGDVRCGEEGRRIAGAMGVDAKSVLPLSKPSAP